MPSVDLNDVLMDEEDRARLSCYRYYHTNDGKYIHREESRTGKSGRPRKQWLIHHDIVGKPPRGMEVDHINGNGFDNRKCNLRFVSRSCNMQNRRMKGSSGFIGVFKATNQRGFFAGCHLNKKMYYLGKNNNPVLCAIAYDDFQLKHRVNPRLNFETIRARKKALKEWSLKNETKA